jgi:hypothetical protein
MCSVRIAVPETVADALRGEANRRLVHPGDVLVDFVRSCWPSYVANQLVTDLRPVLDAEGEDVVEVERADEPEPAALERGSP